MEIITQVIGNAHSPSWSARLSGAEVETVTLDQWTAQKSRFLAVGDRGTECPVALKRSARIADGDILSYDPEGHKALVVRLDLNPVMVVDLSALAGLEPGEMTRVAIELGHALGNQHWPAVVKGYKVYVPLTVDRKVMESVMDTHHIDNISYTFRPGVDVIPYMAPHEIRRLFGGASRDNHGHHACHG